MPPKKTAKTASLGQGAAPAQERKYSSIHVAAETNLVDKLEILLSLGTISIDSIDLEGCTALHRGSQAGSLEAVELLIKHKSNLEARDDRGEISMDNVSKKLIIINSLSKFLFCLQVIPL